MLCAVLLFAARPAGAASVAEYELKAALLYKIAKFVRWPEPRHTTGVARLTFCVVGADPFGPAIDAIVGQLVQARRVAVQRFEDPKDAAASSCDLAFVSAPSTGKMTDSLRALSGRPILTVGDVPGFAASGGVLGMRTEQGKVRFEVNLDSSAAQGLEISAQLLRLATIVTGRMEAE